jgi:hypothetical protein
MEKGLSLVMNKKEAKIVVKNAFLTM